MNIIKYYFNHFKETWRQNIIYIMSGDWSQAQINGLKYQFEIMGVEVLAVTDAGFKAEKQVSDIEKWICSW